MKSTFPFGYTKQSLAQYLDYVQSALTHVFLRFFLSPSAPGAGAFFVFFAAAGFFDAFSALAGAFDAVDAGALPAVDAG